MTNEAQVTCSGIVGRQGFAVSPVGFEPTFIEFEPGKPTKMARHYADYLHAQDPQRFLLVEAEKPAAAAPKPNFSEKMKAAKAAKKTQGR